MIEILIGNTGLCLNFRGNNEPSRWRVTSRLWIITQGAYPSQGFLVGFVRLPEKPKAIGHAFHIPSDELFSWNQIYEIAASTAGVEPKIVHIPPRLIGGTGA
ncbi:MAG: hypothetical protein JXA19_04555 [Anaerolineales bacterium]|nr:hypothetical protein [Anaerolineales bacterium]